MSLPRSTPLESQVLDINVKLNEIVNLLIRLGATVQSNHQESMQAMGKNTAAVGAVGDDVTALTTAVDGLSTAMGTLNTTVTQESADVASALQILQNANLTPEEDAALQAATTGVNNITAAVATATAAAQQTDTAVQAVINPPAPAPNPAPSS
jgi:hypothetical protein